MLRNLHMAVYNLIYRNRSLERKLEKGADSALFKSADFIHMMVV